jgi:hypothetical protein
MTMAKTKMVPVRHCEAAGGHRWVALPYRFSGVLEAHVVHREVPTVRELLSGNYRDWEALPGRAIIAREDRLLHGLWILLLAAVRRWRLRYHRCPAKAAHPRVRPVANDEDLPF